MTDLRLPDTLGKVLKLILTIFVKIPTQAVTQSDLLTWKMLLSLELTVKILRRKASPPAGLLCAPRRRKPSIKDSTSTS